MSRPKVTVTQTRPDAAEVERLRASLAPASGGPQDPEVRRLKARVALLEQQVQALMARVAPGAKWVVAKPSQH